MRAAAAEGAEAINGKEWTEAEREVRRQNAMRNDLAQYLRSAVRDETWTEDEIALLGQLSDAKVASKIRRTADAVRQKREELGVPNPTTTRWSAEELALLGTMSDAEVASKIGRSPLSVTQKRCKLELPPFREAVHESVARANDPARRASAGIQSEFVAAL